MTDGPGPGPGAWRRVLTVALPVVGLGLLISLRELHGWLVGLLPLAEPYITAHPLLGRVAFVGLAAASAMLAFVSSALVVPVGVYAWGAFDTLLLLWTGWILGGVTAYSLSRFFGRPAVRALLPAGTLDRYEARFSRRTPFGLVLLFQLAVPSEIPGYLLGLLRYRFGAYVAALALAELPYAAGTIYLGEGFIEGRMLLVLGVGALVAAFGGAALYVLHRRLPPPV